MWYLLTLNAYCLSPVAIADKGQIVTLERFATEHQIQVPRRLRDRILFIGAHTKETTGDIVGGVARATDLTWAKEEKRLDRASAVDRGFAQRHRLLRKKAIATELASLRRNPSNVNIDAKQIGDGLKSRIEKLRLGLPSGNVINPNPAQYLLHSLVMAMGSDALASLPVGEPAWFSTVTGPNLTPLGPKAAEPIRDFVAITKAVVDLAAQFPTESAEERQIVTDAGGLRPPGDEVRVVLSFLPRHESINALVRCYTREGELIAYASQRIAIPLASKARETEGLGSHPALHRSVPLCPASLDYLKNLNEPFPSLSATSSNLLESPALREAMSDPEFDLLQLGPREAFAALAEHVEERVVAVLDDRMIAIARRCLQRDGTLDGQRFFRDLVALGYQFERGDGWLIVKPDDPFLSEAISAPRAPFARWTSALLREGAMTLRTYCQGIAATRTSREYGFVDAWQTALALSGVEPLLPATGMLEPAFYAFLGTLPDSLWNRALAGEALKPVGLPSEAAKALRAYAGGRLWQPTLPSARAMDAEPALCLGHLSDPRSTMTFKVGDEEVIQADTRGGVLDWYSVFPTAPADARVVAQTAGTLVFRRLANSIEDAMKDKYRYGRRMTLASRIGTPAATLDSSMRGAVTWSAGKAPYKNLPKSFLNAVQREADAFLREQEPPRSSTPPTR